MGTLIFILILLVCILLVLVVLIQNPKGGGISSSFGALNQIGGVKQTSDGIEKITWGLATTLIVLCLLSAPANKGTNKKAETGKVESSIPAGLGAPAPKQ